MAVALVSTFDMERVRNILVDKDVWGRFSDGVDPEDYYPSYSPMNKWFLVQDENEDIGVFYVNTDTSCSILIHPYLYKAHRHKGREMMKLFFQWFLTLPEQIVKINAVIPESFPSAISFSEKVGFQREGFSRNSYNHNGDIVNRVILGMTRKEVQAWVA